MNTEEQIKEIILLHVHNIPVVRRKALTEALSTFIEDREKELKELYKCLHGEYSGYMERNVKLVESLQTRIKELESNAEQERRKAFEAGRSVKFENSFVDFDYTPESKDLGENLNYTHQSYESYIDSLSSLKGEGD